jgi:uncharacterized hydrophobic protein (TIGR00271 family)
MLQLRVFGASGSLTEVGEALQHRGETRNVVVAPALRPGHALLTAEISPGSADEVLEFVLGRGVAPDDIAIARLDEIGPIAQGRRGASLIWADVLGQAHRNARPVARYLVFMIAAGVIAGFGVIDDNGILIVGAMAISPDILPIAAICVGLASRRPGLAWRALVTLVIGLGATCVTAIVLGFVLDRLDLLPSGFDVGESGLSGLTTVNSATIGVALAAGVAGMLALETRASSAVGVAISITTIPAAAYLGVAAGVGQADKVPGALAVLAVNVAMLLVAGTATLILQRRLAERTRRAPAGN